MDTTATEPQVLYETLGPVARITQNRPATGNAQGTRLLEELDAAVQRATADDDVRVLIIAGAGKHFSSGHDLKEGEAEGRGSLTVEQRFLRESRVYYDFTMRIWDCPKPTIAQVQGACIAGGFMTANVCDLIVASDDAFFADPVVNTLGAAAVEVLIHPTVMGLRKAKDILFTGRRMDAKEALDCGMVSRVVPRDALEAETLALARQIAETPPFALRLLKRSMHRALDIQGFRAGLEAHFDTHQLSHVTTEFQEVVARGLSGAIRKTGA
ncbi:MAG: enoyl-CoA hydratase [Sagittula sp.]|uniref:enoyl-CoA hydratase n=1 Tax=Sagittula sp. TaxID=2038081 RepID=UPI004059D123